MEQLPDTLSLDTRVNISILSAASVALLTEQDVNAAGLASTNAIQNNFCEPPLSKEELERQCEAIKSVVKDVTAEIPGCLSFRGDMHARVEDGFDFIQNFIQDMPFLETLRSFYESNPRASRMLPLPIQGMIYSRSISHLGVDLIMPVTILDMGLSLPVVGQGLGMGVKGVGFGLRKGAPFLSNAWSRFAGAEKLAVQSRNIITSMDLAYNSKAVNAGITWEKRTANQNVRQSIVPPSKPIVINTTNTCSTTSTASPAQSTAKPLERSKNYLKPSQDASGAHTSFKINKDRQVIKYETYEPNPQNPNGFDSVKRVDLEGKTHFNKKMGLEVPTPHVQGKDIPGGVRPAHPNEIPKANIKKEPQ